MKSQYYVPLFDNENGGPAEAYKCMACYSGWSLPYNRRGKENKTITYTEGGMVSHLRQFHEIEVKTIPLWQNKEDSQQPQQAQQATMQKKERSTQNGGENNQE